jgi:hypothetical protein
MLTRSRPSQVSVCLNTPRKHSQLIMSHTAAFRCQTPCRLSTRGRRIVGLCFAGLVHHFFSICCGNLILMSRNQAVISHEFAVLDLGERLARMSFLSKIFVLEFKPGSLLSRSGDLWSNRSFISAWLSAPALTSSEVPCPCLTICFELAGDKS